MATDGEAESSSSSVDPLKTPCGEQITDDEWPGGVHSLGDGAEVGQQVLGDDGDERLGRVVQQVTLQDVQHPVECPHAAGQVGAAQGGLQQAAHRLRDGLVLWGRRGVPCQSKRYRLYILVYTAYTLFVRTWYQ